MRLLILLIILLQLSGCSVKATKSDDGTMLLKGWGAKKAVFQDGSSIEKQEPIRTPDIMPITR